MRTLVKRMAVLVCLALTISLPAWPQVTGTATLTGTVTDQTGAVVPGAEVKVTQQETGATRTAKTDAAGKFLLSQLPPGKYDIEVRMSGFKATVLKNQDVLVGLTTPLDIELEIGQITEEVVVEGIAVGLNTTDASLGTPLSGTEVQSLPVLDRNPAGLLSLQAGVTYVASASDTAGGYGGVSDFDGRSGAVSGARSDQTNVTLDGVDVNDPVKGYAFTSVLRVTQASLGEFRTVTTNYNSDSGGRSSAAQVQLHTKSGTNSPHGEIYYVHRNEALNANDFFLNAAGLKEPKFRRHLYGAALGGPIVKDRFFLFGNWERLEESLFRSALREVPSMHLRDGVFMYLCEGDPACPTTETSVTGISGQPHTVPANHFGLNPQQWRALDPLGLGPCSDATCTAPSPAIAYFGGYPEPNASGNFDALNYLGFRFGAPVDNTFNTYILKADFNIDRAAKHTVFWRGNLQDDVVNQEPQFPGGPARRASLNANKGHAVGYTAVLSPTVVNTFRYGLTRIKEQNSGLYTEPFVNFRFVDELEGFLTEQAGIYNSNSGRTIPQHHIRDDVSYTVGRHTLTFGGEVRYTRNAKFNNVNSFPFFSMNPSWLAGGGGEFAPGSPDCIVTVACNSFPVVAAAGGSSFNDGFVVATGVITQATQSANYDRTGATLPEGDPVSRRFAVDEYEFYVQNQWRMTSTLTITGGLRWMYTSPPWETNGNQVVPNPRLNDYFETRRALMLAGRPTIDAGRIEFRLGGKANNAPGYYPDDYNNWSPRVAVAWAPRHTEGFLGKLFGDGKMAIRGGWSLVYDRVGNGLATSFDENGSFGMSTLLDSAFGACDPGDLTTCARFTGIFDTTPTRNTLLPAAPAGGFPSTPPDGFLLISNALDDSIRTPYAHTINFSIARELPWDLTVEAAYVGRRGRKLLLIRDLAMPADLVSSVCGVSAFQAERELVAYAAAHANDPDGGLNALPASCFWETHFPSFGPSGINQGCLGFETFGVSGCGFSATQVAYDHLIFWHGTAAGGAGFGAVTLWSTTDGALFGSPPDPFCFNGCFLDPGADGVVGTADDPADIDGDGLPDAPYAFFPPQFADLQAWGSVARSEYHAFQLMIRKRMSHGVLFNFNYTLSKSLDHSSTPERADTFFGFFAGGYSGSTINAWDIDQEYSFSDYDMRHQVNAYWAVDLPIGKGHAFGSGMPGWADQILGGWQLSGIVRWNSGLPAGVINGRTWPTNWDLQGNATCAPVGAHPFGLDYGPCPPTQNVHDTVDGRGPNMFRDPEEAFGHFRFTAPGDRGGRNNLRADGYFNLDFGIRKNFDMPWEGHRFEFRWDMFNLTNSVYFDAVSLNASVEDLGTFGNYTAILGQPRQMQFTLRYVF